MHCQNVRVVFNFTETVNSRNKSQGKFKAFTPCAYHMLCSNKAEEQFYGA